MGIVSFQSAVSKLHFLLLLGLIVLSFSASEHCILSGSSWLNDSCKNLGSCGKKISSVILVQEPELSYDDSISGHLGSYQVLLDVKGSGNLSGFGFETFEFWAPSHLLHSAHMLPVYLTRVSTQYFLPGQHSFLGLSYDSSFNCLRSPLCHAVWLDAYRFHILTLGDVDASVGGLGWIGSMKRFLEWCLYFMQLFFFFGCFHYFMLRASAAFHPYAILFFGLLNLPGVVGVTCYTCYDQITGCAGGANCPFLTSTATNAAAIVATGVAALTIDSLLPREWVRHLSSEVLRTLQAIARAPTGALAPDITNLDLQGLMAAYQHAPACTGKGCASVSTRTSVAEAGSQAHAEGHAHRVPRQRGSSQEIRIVGWLPVEYAPSARAMAGVFAVDFSNPAVELVSSDEFGHELL